MLMGMCRFRRVKQRQCYAYIWYAVRSWHNVTTPCWYKSVFKWLFVFFCGAFYLQKCRKQFFFNATSEVDILGDELNKGVCSTRKNVMSMTNIRQVKVENLATVLFLGSMSSIWQEHELGGASWPFNKHNLRFSQLFKYVVGSQFLI